MKTWVSNDANCGTKWCSQLIFNNFEKMVFRRPVQHPKKEEPAQSFNTVGRANSDYLFSL
jgi:hypothetical protein